MKKLLFGLLLITFTLVQVSADDDPLTPWPIEEHCINEPIQPPKDWSYSGTLLMTGYAGIHAVQSDWETPRIEAFFSTDALGYPLEGGQLSPDGQWYAVPIGTVTTSRSLNRYWQTEALRVYSLVDDGVRDFVISDFADELDYSNFFEVNWVHHNIQWVDNETVIIGGLQIYPFEAEVALAPFDAIYNYYELFGISPDGQRAFGWLRDGSGQGVFNPYNWEEKFSSLELVDGVAWQHSSNGFIAEHRIDTYKTSADYLSLYNRDGEFIETLFQPAELSRLNIQRPVSGRSELGWSNDDAYFAFVYRSSYQEPSKLLLLDFENQVVVDTCIAPVSQPVWSPDGRQLAILLDGRQNLRVVIVDIDEWQAYDVARHIRASGKLNPNMLAWRDDN